MADRKSGVILSKKIYKQAIISASVKTVWKKWTTEKGMKTFLVNDCKIKLVIGGPYELYFLEKNKYGSKGSEDCKVLSYLPKQMLTFSWSAPPEYPSIRYNAHKTWVVVQFFPIGKNKTRMELTHLGWKKGGDWDKVFKYFDRAWGWVMKELKKSCKS